MLAGAVLVAFDGMTLANSGALVTGAVGAAVFNHKYAVDGARW